MGIRHRTFPVEGIQFHPESVMTGQGKALLKNFLAPDTAGGPSAVVAGDFTPLLEKAVSGKILEDGEMRSAVGMMMAGQVSDLRIAGFLSALRSRGETVEELAAACGAMMENAVRVRSGRFCVDTCGTGGDGTGTFNISTAAAFVAAGAGVSVAKHGNRSITSRCGSSDVLQALGVKVDAQPALMEKALHTEGIAFFFAPLYHPAMKYVMAARRELKVRTMFNILGPLSNPASAAGRVLGVFDPSLLELVPKVLLAIGVERAFVLRSQDGMDELSLNAPADLVQIEEGRIRRLSLDPQKLGFKPCRSGDIAGGSAEDNARRILYILNGERGPGRDITVLNAAAAILVAGLASDFEGAIGLAERSLDTRRAYEKLQALKSISNGALL